MAFESLGDKFAGIFKKMRGNATLNEKNMDDMLKEIRVALLEADVNFKVVKAFVNDVKEKAIGQDVYHKVNPSQMVVKIVHDEIQALLGEEQCGLVLEKSGLTSILLLGLQGSHRPHGHRHHEDGRHFERGHHPLNPRRAWHTGSFPRSRGKDGGSPGIRPRQIPIWPLAWRGSP